MDRSNSGKKRMADMAVMRDVDCWLMARKWVGIEVNTCGYLYGWGGWVDESGVNEINAVCQVVNACLSREL